ncbi:neutral zinc metallopeptidase [Peptoniphilus sp. MSJ-1]|uniref:Neutral zinc metallopeptidase n=1 Tax=Peptoniphilus ovalis TaxID=2841503 RepID=A0ABS6FER0_9FIRM|nr:neutral zinc metallopeptidase [Peptoniphilus ovalis]MBU5668664.1 neutral zinc metallopeptidase [Peptoniphilus ovalis]
MKWRGRRQSSNIGNSGRGRGGGLALGGGGLIVALIVFLLTGSPSRAILSGLGSGSRQTPTTQEYNLTEKEQELYDYSAVVLADTEDAWTEILKTHDIKYREPKLNIFKDVVQSGCGTAQSGMGPFYCSRDESIYMDLSFYDSLINDFGAKEGDFILSYVISHEVGHHVQNLTGIMGQYQELMQKMSEEERNALTVRLELQADYLAGVVARYQADKGYLEPGDMEEAISTAWSIGDDTIQKKSQGYVRPESFTHGSSEQRTRWFKKGYEAGDLSGWDTFNTNNL